MQFRWAVVVACALLLVAGFASVRAEDTPEAKKSDAAATAGGGKGRLTMPWSKISSLSDDQKSKIKAIHATAIEEAKKIKDKETADIMALLSDEQKTEAKALMEKSTADAKLKAAGAKKEAGAAGEEKKASDAKKADEKSSS